MCVSGYCDFLTQYTKILIRIFMDNYNIYYCILWHNKSDSFSKMERQKTEPWTSMKYEAVLLQKCCVSETANEYLPIFVLYNNDVESSQHTSGGMVINTPRTTTDYRYLPSLPLTKTIFEIARCMDGTVKLWIGIHYQVLFGTGFCYCTFCRF